MTRSEKKAKKAVSRAARKRREARINAKVAVSNKAQFKKAPDLAEFWSDEGDRFIQMITDAKDGSGDIADAFHLYRGIWGSKNGDKQYVGIHKTADDRFVVGVIDCVGIDLSPALYFGKNGNETWDTIVPALDKTDNVAHATPNSPRVLILG